MEEESDTAADAAVALGCRGGVASRGVTEGVKGSFVISGKDEACPEDTVGRRKAIDLTKITWQFSGYKAQRVSCEYGRISRYQGATNIPLCHQTPCHSNHASIVSLSSRHETS